MSITWIHNWCAEPGSVFTQNNTENKQPTKVAQFIHHTTHRILLEIRFVLLHFTKMNIQEKRPKNQFVTQVNYLWNYSQRFGRLLDTISSFHWEALNFHIITQTPKSKFSKSSVKLGKKAGDGPALTPTSSPSAINRPTWFCLFPGPFYSAPSLRSSDTDGIKFSNLAPALHYYLSSSPLIIWFHCLP